MAARYLSCAETAKLVRGALGRAFPGHRFSVRSHVYAGGASINVKWANGPTQSTVEAVAGQFAGGRFDGMIDLAYSVQHYLTAGGTVRLAYSPGTTSGRGTHEPLVDEPPAEAAELVRFGADHVFCTRDLSPWITRRAEAAARAEGWENYELDRRAREIAGQMAFAPETM